MRAEQTAHHLDGWEHTFSYFLGLVAHKPCKGTGRRPLTTLPDGMVLAESPCAGPHVVIPLGHDCALVHPDDGVFIPPLVVYADPTRHNI